MLVVRCGCDVGTENVITITALSRRIDGSVMVWVGFRFHRRVALHVCRGRMNGIYYQDNVFEITSFPSFISIRDMHTFQENNARAHTHQVLPQSIKRTIMFLCLHGHHRPLTYRQYSIFEVTLVNASHVVHK